MEPDDILETGGDAERPELIQGQIVFPNTDATAIIFANHISAIPDPDIGIVFITFGQFAAPDASGLTSEQIAEGIIVPGRTVGRIALPMSKFRDFLAAANKLAPRWFGTESDLDVDDAS